MFGAEVDTPNDFGETPAIIASKISKRMCSGSACGRGGWGSGLGRREALLSGPSSLCIATPRGSLHSISRRTWEAERGSFLYPRTGALTSRRSPPGGLPPHPTSRCQIRGGEEARQQQQPCPSPLGISLTEPRPKCACMPSCSRAAACTACLRGEPCLQGWKRQLLLTGSLEPPLQAAEAAGYLLACAWEDEPVCPRECTCAATSCGILFSSPTH